jgi:hypothetical protein
MLWRMIIGLATLCTTSQLHSLVDWFCSGLKWTLHLMTVQILNRMKSSGVKQWTDNTLPGQLTRCNSMVVWSLRFQPSYGKFGLHRAVSSSPGWCSRTVFGRLIGGCRDNGLINISAPSVVATLRPLTHLITECSMSCSIWEVMGSWVQLLRLCPQNWHPKSHLMDWFNELSDASGSSKAKGTRSLIILDCWSIWWECDARIFDDQEKDLNRLISEIKDEASLWSRAGAKDLSR